MKKAYLGEFEELVLTMVAFLQEDAYGFQIVKEILNQTGRKVNLSAVHITLYRLEEKGMVSSHFGGTTNRRGGRRKRIFIITNTGMNTLKKIKEMRIGLWNLIPQLNYGS